MLKKLPQPSCSAVFYNVYLYGFDSEKCDILADIRKKYLSTGLKSKDKVFLTADGNSQKIYYTIENSKPLKWKKTLNGETVQTSVAQNDGGYYIESSNGSKVIKKQYFNNSHFWVKTEYFDELIKSNNCSLVPWKHENNAAIIKYGVDSQKPVILYAVSTPDNKELLKELISYAPPEAAAYTSEGYFCFCDEEAYKRWNEFLNKKDSSHNEKTVPRSKNGFTFDSNIANPAKAKDIFTGAEIFEGEKAEPIKEASVKITSPVLNKTTEISIPVDKVIKANENEDYYYCGSLDKQNNRMGYGRTILPNGKTAYDGHYLYDMRDGFGAYYYKNGKPCYVGNWKSNKRNGLGIAFRTSDYSTHIGQFENDAPKGNCARFDKSGSLSYVGNWSKGTKSGVGIEVSENGSYIISSYTKGEASSIASIVSADGLLQYSGEVRDGVKQGFGTAFKKDGTIEYSGEFKNNKKSGTGKLYLDDGSVISGKFKNNKPDGICMLYNTQGAILCKGKFTNGGLNGEGIKYFDDGSYISGVFENGNPVGSISLFNRQSDLIYKGEMLNGKFNGEGIIYQNGEKVFEGKFIDGIKSGTGKIFQNGECIYMGSFLEDKRNGFGIEYKDGKPYFTGLWENDLHSKAGILSCGSIKYIGEFKSGKLDGRVNIIKNNSVSECCLYENGLCVYACKYSNDGSHIEYEGNIKDEKREGMGCTFTDYGEKDFEGIFKDDKPFKAMKISLKALASLPSFESLQSTDYQKYISCPEFAVEKPMGVCIYSGGMLNGLPNGRGTAIYGSHRYTGLFKNGSSSGKGKIYLNDGTEINGTFFDSAASGTKDFSSDGIQYYYK